MSGFLSRQTYSGAAFFETKYKQLQTDSVDEIKISGFIPDESQIGKIYSVLKPSSKFLIQNIPDREAGQSLAIDLKILGFVDIITAKGPITFTFYISYMFKKILH